MCVLPVFVISFLFFCEPGREDQNVGLEIVGCIYKNKDVFTKWTCGGKTPGLNNITTGSRDGVQRKQRDNGQQR